MKSVAGGDPQLFEHLKQYTVLRALMDIQSVYYNPSNSVTFLSSTPRIEPLKQMALSILRVEFSSALAFSIESGEYVHPVGWLGDKLLLIPFMGDLVPREIREGKREVVKEQTDLIALKYCQEYNRSGMPPAFIPFDYNCLF